MKYLKFFGTIVFIYSLAGAVSSSQDFIKSKLVRFSPEIYSEGSTEACQGLQVTSRHISTSADCEVAVSKYIQNHEVKLIGPGGRYVGVVEDFKGNIYSHASSRLGSQMILPVKRADSKKNSVIYIDVAPGAQSVNTEAYYLSNGQATSSIISLNMKSNADQSQYEFVAYSGATLPKGAPVVNKDGDVVCFISSKNLCVAPDFTIQESHKRSSGEPCQLKFFQCSNANFTSCFNNGYGEGTCSNNKTGDVCRMETYPNGFNAYYIPSGENMYCHNPEGCEAVVCYSSFTAPATCRASYKLNDSTSKAPCDCIEYTDSSLPCSINHITSSVSDGGHGGANNSSHGGEIVLGSPPDGTTLTQRYIYGFVGTAVVVGIFVAALVISTSVIKRRNATPHTKLAE